MIWIVHGNIGNVKESFSIPVTGDFIHPPVEKGKWIEVLYDPSATRNWLSGRSLRVIIRTDAANSGQIAMKHTALCYCPLIFSLIILSIMRFRCRDVIVEKLGAHALPLIIIVLFGASCVQPHNLMRFSKTIQKYSGDNNANALIGLIELDGVPPELAEDMKRSIRSMLDSGRLETKSLKIAKFSDYNPTSGAPGKHNGIRLKWNKRPTHWIILNAFVARDDGNVDDQIKTSLKMEFAVVESNGRWVIVGPTYEIAPSVNPTRQP